MAYEWIETAPNTLERQLQGAEYLVNLSEVIGNGNYQLTSAVCLGTKLSYDQLETRFGPAWVATRRDVPLLGAEMISPDGDLSKAVFHALETVEQAQEWIESTTEARRITVPLLEEGEVIAATALETPARMAKMHLVCDEENAEILIAIQISHALSGHFNLRILEAFARNLADDSIEKTLEETFRPESISELISRLPGSLDQSYRKTFKPSEQDLKKEMERRQPQAGVTEDTCIGFPILADADDRDSKIHNDRIVLSRSETKSLFDNFHSLRISPTVALFACITAAMAQHQAELQTYDPRVQRGSTLNFSAHGSRWLPCFGEKGDPLITLAIVPSSIYVSTEGLDLIRAEPADLQDLARRIAFVQDEFLGSPHAMGFAHQMAKDIKGALSSGSSLPERPKPRQSPPILTSQGLKKMQPVFGKGASMMKTLWHEYHGRNTDPTVCFALATHFSTVRVQTIYDEKYFEPEQVRILQANVLRLWRSMAVSPLGTHAARL